MHRTIPQLATLALIGLVACASPEKKQQPPMDMKAMAEAMAKMGALNENHKLLEYMVGTWDYRIKMWMDPSAPPQESSGVAENKAVWGGRYFHSEYTGKMDMPGPDGKPTTFDFAGMGLTGYDNLKQKFFTAFADNMGTGLLVLEGTYNAASKTFTYGGQMECPMTPPGTMMKIRETIQVVDTDHHTFEWYENRDGKEVRTMEIRYTRKK